MTLELVKTEALPRLQELGFKGTNLPSLELVRKWLREDHQISIKIDDFRTEKGVRYDYNVSTLGSQEDNPMGHYSTYEDALESAIDYTIEIILREE